MTDHDERFTSRHRRSGATPPAPRDKEATRQRLLDAAEEVFAEKGYHGAVVEDIIRVSDSSKGGFYFHFPNKQGIFLALIDALVPKLAATVDHAIAKESDPIAQMEAALRTVLETFSRHRKLSKILLVEAVGLGHGFDEKLMHTRVLRRHDPALPGLCRQRGGHSSAGYGNCFLGMVRGHQ